MDQIHEAAVDQSLFVRKDEDPPSLARAWNNRLVTIDFYALQQEFNTDRNVIEADWNEWLKKTSF